MLLLAGGGFGASAQEDVPEVAQRKLDEANRHREAGRTEDAIARYQEVLASAPGLLEAYVGLGALYHENGQFEKASEVFDITPVNARACRYMTITCDVKPEWRDRIAAVVHVDGSARPQTIGRQLNPLYYDVLDRFGQLTGLPVLVNTSFNVHEEPIVNRPSECAKALVDGRIDFLVTDRGLYGCR